MPKELTLTKRRAIDGAAIDLPGSKSITNRALLLAALSDNFVDLTGVLDSEDTRHMLSALRDLGVKIAENRDGSLRIQGCRGRFPAAYAHLFLGNAGTAMRPLAAALAFQKEGAEYALDGVERMRMRPIGDLVDALRSVGADVDYSMNVGYPPLLIKPFVDNNERIVVINGEISSQFLTSLLMALPITGAKREVRVRGKLISKPYVDVTLRLMKRFGAQVENDNFERFVLPAGQSYHAPSRFFVESDASSASYFAAAAFLSGSSLTLKGLGRNSIQGDARFVEILARLGADVRYDGDRSVTVTGPRNGVIPAFDVDALEIPDAAMTLAIVALKAQGTSRIRNIASWRVKETDRIAAMKTELEKLGARVAADDDSIAIEPPSGGKLNNLRRIETYDDHRMAMCFALVSLLGADVVIVEPDCVRKTYPNFFDDFEAATDPLPGGPESDRFL